MTTTKYADVRIELTVRFDDDGDGDLMDQAIDAACEYLSISPHALDGIEVVGKVRDTPTPEASP